MVYISQIRYEPSEWNIISSSNVIPVESLGNMSSKADLQPVNVKLSVYNALKILLVGKCSLTLDHKDNSFKVLFIVLD